MKRFAPTIISVLLLLTACVQAFAATPPTQPPDGPGGASYSHAAVAVVEKQSGAQGWWLFTPADPVPKTAPVVVFLHGWGAMNPAVYRGWIDHIVRRGNIVVFPNYQDSLLTRPDDFLPNALSAIHAALDSLKSGSIRADFSKLAIVGHSAGGLLTAEIAARAGAEHLPAFGVVMPVEPGDGKHPLTPRRGIPSIEVTDIPSTTLMLVVVGEEDHLAGEELGLRLFDQAVHVPASQKNVVELRSDYHGSPALIANHAAPAALLAPIAERQGSFASQWFPQRDLRNRDSIDAMDWYGPWKLFDALCDAAFQKGDRKYALGGTPQQLSMGVWSDGVPVRTMRVLR